MQLLKVVAVLRLAEGAVAQLLKGVAVLRLAKGAVVQLLKGGAVLQLAKGAVLRLAKGAVLRLAKGKRRARCCGWQKGGAVARLAKGGVETPLMMSTILVRKRNRLGVCSLSGGKDPHWRLVGLRWREPQGTGTVRWR